MGVAVNRTYWKSDCIVATPVYWVERETGATLPSADLFQIRCAGTRLGVTHIPKSLQSYFSQAAVIQFVVEVLPVGRLASRLLPGSPSRLVCAVTTQEGDEVAAMPRALRLARRGLLLTALALGAGAGYMLATTVNPTLSALCMASGVLALRAATDIPSA